VIEAPFTPVYVRNLRAIGTSIVMADNKDPSKSNDRGGIDDLPSDFAELPAGDILNYGVDVQGPSRVDDGSGSLERLRRLCASGGLDTGPAASALPRREGHREEAIPTRS